MALFTEESVIRNHPEEFFAHGGPAFTDGRSEGLEEIRTLLAYEMELPGALYEFSNYEVSGNTVTWDSVYAAPSKSDDFCAEGHRAVVEDSKILSWDYRQDAPCP